MHAQPSSLTRSFQRYVLLAAAVPRNLDMPSLDAVEERLLLALVAMWSAGETVPVLHAMNALPAVSASTVHRRLKSLRAKGLIVHREDAADQRLKYVEPTALANRYFAALAVCMKQALRG